MPLYFELSPTAGVWGRACHKTSGAFLDIARA
jgi:hypothetical protein